jgi:uncharacterized protein DUF1839
MVAMCAQGARPVKLRVWDLDPAAYAPHPLHAADRAWPESNCSVDLWVELLHTAGAEPLAALPFCLAIDLEGDQWTFFKFPLADLDALYGVDVFELNVWCSLAGHVAEQLALGRPAIVEVDAFYLPDTAGTSYRANHVKTSIGIQAIDLEGRRLGYFHNAGYYELSGDDFAGVFRLEGHLTHAEYLPPYVEVAKLHQRAPRTGRALFDASLALLRTHLARRPATNPFHRYAARFPADLASLAGQPLSSFHNYAFATLRQCGAAFELGSTYFCWLEERGECGLQPAAAACARIATTAKALQFKTARAVNTQKPFDPAPMLETMSAAWDETMTTLTACYGN